MVCCGVLALQGAFREHCEMLKSLNCNVIEIRELNDLHGIDGIIIPGGESTVMRKLGNQMGLLKEIQRMAKNDKIPVFGTCAGLILLSKTIQNDKEDNGLALLDVCVERNSYGSQLDSFVQKVSSCLGEIEGVFIRAPKIISTAENVEILATFKHEVVAVRQGNVLGCSFHPELTRDSRFHEYFIAMCMENK